MNDLLIPANLLDGPKHGYALKKQVGLIFGREEMHNNLVYPLLRRFVQNAWVSKREVSGQRGQTREVYALTSKGKSELIRRLETFTEKEAASQNEFFLRAGFLWCWIRRRASAFWLNGIAGWRLEKKNWGGWSRPSTLGSGAGKWCASCASRHTRSAGGSRVCRRKI